MYQFPKSWYDPACPTNTAYRLGEDPHCNNYNPVWRTQPDLSWQSQPVVAPGPQRTPIIDVPYDDRPGPYYQSDPHHHPFPTYNSSFEEETLQIIDRINEYSEQLSVNLNKNKVGEVPSQHEHHLDGPYPPSYYNLSFEEQALLIIDRINSHSDQRLAELSKTRVGEVPSQIESNLKRPYPSPNSSLSFEEEALHIIDNIHRHSDQLLAAFNREKVVPSHLESNLEGPYLTHDFNNPLSCSAQSNTTRTDNWTTKRPCTIMETHSIEVDRPHWWGEPLLSSTYAPRVPFPVILEASTPLECMEKDKVESLENPQEMQQNNITREAIPLPYPQKALDPYMAHYTVDNFNEYTTKINDPFDTPYFEPTSLWTKQYEPTSSPPIVPLLETPPCLEMKPLPVMPTDTLLITYSQKARIVGVLNSHRKAVGWDICQMRDSNFIADLAIFGTTLEDCLQNLSFILKRCMETNLKLTWIVC